MLRLYRYSGMFGYGKYITYDGKAYIKEVGRQPNIADKLRT